jgi:hypothetical protein
VVKEWRIGCLSAWLPSAAAAAAYGGGESSFSVLDDDDLVWHSFENIESINQSIKQASKQWKRSRLRIGIVLEYIQRKQ